jgi:hypothetical protein
MVGRAILANYRSMLRDFPQLIDVGAREPPTIAL